MPAPRNNKNAAGKRVERERLPLTLALSEKNGLLELFSRYLSMQGEEPTDENIKQVARDWAYQAWGDRLKREIERAERAILA